MKNRLFAEIRREWVIFKHHLEATIIKEADILNLDHVYDLLEETEMPSNLEQEEYLYRRAIEIIESVDSDEEKEDLLFQEVWVPLAAIYKDKISD